MTKFLRFFSTMTLLLIVSHLYLNAEPQSPEETSSQVFEEGYIEKFDKKYAPISLGFSSVTSDNEKTSIEIYAGHLEQLITEKHKVDAIYYSAIHSILNAAPLSINGINIEFRNLEGGYCDPARYSVLFKVSRNENGTITALDRTTGNRKPPNGGYLCSLNFQAIERYEQSVNDAGDSLDKLSASTADLDGVFGSEQIRSFIDEYFSDASIRHTKFSDDVIAATITGMKGRVIAGGKYWERLQIVIVTYRTDNEERLQLVLDGQYAAGIAEPSLKGYIDMEPAYTSNLLEFGQSMIYAISNP